MLQVKSTRVRKFSHKLPHNSVAMAGAWQTFKHSGVCHGTAHNLFTRF